MREFDSITEDKSEKSRGKVSLVRMTVLLSVLVASLLMANASSETDEHQMTINGLQPGLSRLDVIRSLGDPLKMEDKNNTWSYDGVSVVFSGNIIVQVDGDQLEIDNIELVRVGDSVNLLETLPLKFAAMPGDTIYHLNGQTVVVSTDDGGRVVEFTLLKTATSAIDLFSRW